jgi:hypothetical protein
MRVNYKLAIQNVAEYNAILFEKENKEKETLKTKVEKLVNASTLKEIVEVHKEIVEEDKIKKEQEKKKEKTNSKTKDKEQEM